MMRETGVEWPRKRELLEARASCIAVNDAPATVCPHWAPVIYSKERGFAFKGDCGSRASCYAAREHWRRQTSARLERVEYLRVPDLWTITARTKEQDALRIAEQVISERLRRGEPVRDTAERVAPLCMYKAEDYGDPSNRKHVRTFSVGISRVVRALRRQFVRQQVAGYRDSTWAKRLEARHGTRYPLRGRSGASWRVTVKEAGEQNGRLHAHAASDFDFIHHGWLSHVARRCGLGFVQYSRKESAGLKRAARAAGAKVRAATIGRYLAKYLGKGDSAERPWPWPRHTRLLNAARGVLPKLPKATDCTSHFGVWRGSPRRGWVPTGAMLTHGSGLIWSIRSDRNLFLQLSRSVLVA